jgi:hypothetical protein
MSNVVVFANQILQANEMSNASFIDCDADEPQIWHDEAFIEIGGDPVLAPLVELLFKSSETQTLAWARQIAEAA